MSLMFLLLLIMLAAFLITKKITFIKLNQLNSDELKRIINHGNKKNQKRMAKTIIAKRRAKVIEDVEKVYLKQIKRK
ncbi:MAG: hypothetical protein ABF804_11355 [Liquorilactobacillus ghanensis]|uniref:hypothetical protein n=1 Tax=Liquorilactobacillus ghanensis TaxID=399370 RepID=UPI0039E7EC97